MRKLNLLEAYFITITRKFESTPVKQEKKFNWAGEIFLWRFWFFRLSGLVFKYCIHHRDTGSTEMELSSAGKSYTLGVLRESVVQNKMEVPGTIGNLLGRLS